MGFKVIQKSHGGGAKPLTGVSIGSIHRPAGRCAACIILGADVLNKMGWKRGIRIEAAQNAGELRLRRGDLSGFVLVQGRRSQSAQLCITTLAGTKPMPRKAVPHKIKNGALYITLPDWAAKA